MVNLPSINSTHYAKLYPQNDERIVTIDYVTVFHPMYTTSTVLHGSLGWPFPMLICKYIFSNKIYGRNFIKKHPEAVIL